MPEAVGQISLNKLPPYNLEAEEGVLGACLKSGEALARALEILGEDDFYKSSHQKIFRAMRVLFESNDPVDILAVSEQLRKKDLLIDVGGLDYLTSLKILFPPRPPSPTTPGSSGKKRSFVI